MDIYIYMQHIYLGKVGSCSPYTLNSKMSFCHPQTEIPRWDEF